jgi:hypothetical protein
MVHVSHFGEVMVESFPIRFLHIFEVKVFLSVGSIFQAEEEEEAMEDRMEGCSRELESA